MKKLIIVLLLVPGYALSMRTNAPSIRSEKDFNTLRSECEALMSAIGQAPASPAQAQAHLQSIGNRLTQLTADIANSKKQAIRQNIRSKVQSRRQGVSAQPQNNILDEYAVLEQQLQYFTKQLSSLIESSAKAASRYNARVQQNRINRESAASRAQMQQRAIPQQTVRPVASQQQKSMRKNANTPASSAKQATPQVYTIDYTKE